MRALLAFSLAALIALTSQSLAVARGQAVATGQMVICSGGQIVTVAVDAEGNPTTPGHICPDCALKVLVLTALPPGPGFVPLAARIPRAPGAAPSRTDAPAIPAKARAPPLSA